MHVKALEDTRSLQCGELAKIAGVSTDTIRHYERSGLLQSAIRSANGYRHFSPQSIKRVSAIRAAISLGFTVRELSGVFQERDSGGTPCKKVRTLAENKMIALAAEIRHLRLQQRRFRKIIEIWDKSLETCEPGQRARLLDQLAAMRFPNSGVSPNFPRALKGLSN